MIIVKKQDIEERTFQFGVSIVKLAISLPKNVAGYKIGDQVIRSGTSIGANVTEAQNSSTKKEFIHSMTIALKEARETLYWLKIICETNLVTKEVLNNIINENIEIIKILTTIIKNTKKNLIQN